MPTNSPLLIGITGGIGSGKSTVCSVFSTLGVPVYDADQRAKILMLNDINLVQNIKSEFSDDAYLPSGHLNRDFLAKTVFSDPEKLSKLNSIVHPAVAKDFELWASEKNSEYVIKEAALLIESGSYKQLDKLINVSAPIDLRIERIESRDTFRSDEEINKIIRNQLSEEERNEKADFIVKNDETESVISQVLELHNTFIENRIQ